MEDEGKRMGYSGETSHGMTKLSYRMQIYFFRQYRQTYKVQYDDYLQASTLVFFPVFEGLESTWRNILSIYGPPKFHPLRLFSGICWGEPLSGQLSSSWP